MAILCFSKCILICLILEQAETFQLSIYMNSGVCHKQNPKNAPQTLNRIDCPPGVIANLLGYKDIITCILLHTKNCASLQVFRNNCLYFTCFYMFIQQIFTEFLQCTRHSG